VQTRSDDLISLVRQAIYDTTVGTGRMPNVEDVAGSKGIDPIDVGAAFQTLADMHVVVLQPGSLRLWSAPPFSGVATSFRVHAEGQSWYAPCAWDAFGIPAALHRGVSIEARCAWSGDPLPASVKHGRAIGSGVVHLEVPARRFWDDIFYT
jgi:hypothetical protein